MLSRRGIYFTALEFKRLCQSIFDPGQLKSCATLRPYLHSVMSRVNFYLAYEEESRKVDMRRRLACINKQDQN